MQTDLKLKANTPFKVKITFEQEQYCVFQLLKIWTPL